jgi:hypothetical protein
VVPGESDGENGQRQEGCGSEGQLSDEGVDSADLVGSTEHPDHQ